MSTPKLLTTGEVADVLRLNRKTVERMSLAGQIPYLIVGKRRRYLEEDINNIIYEKYRKV